MILMSITYQDVSLHALKYVKSRIIDIHFVSLSTTLLNFRSTLLSPPLVSFAHH